MEARYRKNAGAVFSLKYHIVFCPKHRRPVLVDGVAARLRGLLADTAAELGLTIHALEVRPDHVHRFDEADPSRCVADIVNRLKGASSRLLRREFSPLRSRLSCRWSRSYYAGTVDHVSEATVSKYIAAYKGK